MAMFWHWEQIVFCGVMFLIGFGLGHLTGMYESLQIVNRSIKSGDEE